MLYIEAIVQCQQTKKNTGYARGYRGQNTFDMIYLVSKVRYFDIIETFDTISNTKLPCRPRPPGEYLVPRSQTVTRRLHAVSVENNQPTKPREQRQKKNTGSSNKA